MSAKTKITIEELSHEQVEIMRHTIHRAANGLYCGGGKDMDALLAKGFKLRAVLDFDGDLKIRLDKQRNLPIIIRNENIL